MGNKLLIIIVIVVLALVGGGIAIYFTLKADKSVDNESAPTTESYEPTHTETGQLEETESVDIGLTDEQNDEFGRLVTKDKFSLRAPEEWLEAQDIPAGTLLIMVNDGEQVNNATAKQIGFRSYFSIVYDNSGQVPQENYLDALKDGLKQVFSGVVFSEKDSISIDGKQAKVLESSLSQQGIDFKILMFVFSGKNKDMWVVSFNTLPEKWNDYQGLFYQMAESFKLK